MRSHLSAALLGALLGCSPPPLPPPGAAPAPASAPAAHASSSAAAASALPAPGASAAPHGPGPGAPVIRVEKPFSVALRLRPDQGVRAFATQPPLLAVSSQKSAPQFLVFEGGNLARAAGLSSGWPAGTSLSDASIVGDPRGRLWALVPDTPGDNKSYRALEGAAGWKLAGRVAHPEGGPVLIGPQGNDLLALAHGDASMVPLFTRVAGAASGTRPIDPAPRLTETPRHPKKCVSQITLAYAFKAFASGEVLLIGASCWIPTLQIERWGKGQQRPDAREIKNVTLQDVVKIDLISPDEIALDGVTIEPPPPGGMALERVKIKLSNGVWKLHDRGPASPLDAEDDNGAKNKLDSLNMDFFESFTAGQERFYLAGYPKKNHVELALLRVGEGPEIDLR